MDMGPGLEDERKGGMTGVWNWGYSEGVEAAAFWGWFGELGKPAHAWAKVATICKASRAVVDNMVVYRGFKAAKFAGSTQGAAEEAGSESRSGGRSGPRALWRQRPGPVPGRVEASMTRPARAQ